MATAKVVLSETSPKRKVVKKLLQIKPFILPIFSPEIQFLLPGLRCGEKADLLTDHV